MKLSYLIDTVILIDHLNGVSSATSWLSDRAEGEAAISVITRAEVLVGAKPAEKVPIHLFLDSFECLSISPGVADLAADLRQKHRWKLPDAFQAALAIKNDLQFVTRNTKDFPKHLPFVHIPYTR